jgi:light-regulated signal transduction histidine kinase (bacteriophytochrome)
MAIKQVWLNLISNAVKYTNQKETAVIEISSETTGDNITYCIKDNGAGFDMRYADKLFGVFQRLHSDEEFEGTGVGLALVHRIISKHGGNIWANAKVNEGAIFHFTLNKS